MTEQEAITVLNCIEAHGSLPRKAKAKAIEALEKQMNSNRNSGYWNAGNWNTGNWNTGDCNTGDWNAGNWNTGDRNTGNRNTGDCNSGDRNSGNRNSGYWNAGNWNTGDWNTGDRNTGNWNTGNRNTGDCNSGDRNTGNWNSGDWNSANNESGVFNTRESTIRMFDNPSEWTLEMWKKSKSCKIMRTMPQSRKVVEWIWLDDMSADEKNENKECEVVGGYLKEYEQEVDAQSWWNELQDEEKKEILSLPNFDAEIFKKITAIDLGKE